MINYHSYVLNINDDSLKVSADYNVQFETHEEIYFIDPPKKLVQFISKIFNSSNFDFYKVYFKPMEISKVNRITDYRGIWGLLSLPTGIFNSSCVSTTQKIYFGLDAAQDAMVSSKSNFIICCPKSSGLTDETVFSFIKKLPAESFNSVDVLSKGIYRQDSNLYIINWDAKNMIELSIRGNINKVFSQENLSALKNLAIK